MLRDKNLVSLSRQHQHALALCVRIQRAFRAGQADVCDLQEEIARQFEGEIRAHFEAEEKILFPAAAKFGLLTKLVEELLGEHQTLRRYFRGAAAKKLDSSALQALAQALSSHIRKEERQLFEEMQKLMPPAQMAEIGTGVEDYLRSSGAGAVCALPKTGKAPAG